MNISTGISIFIFSFVLTAALLKVLNMLPKLLISKLATSLFLLFMFVYVLYSLTYQYVNDDITINGLFGIFINAVTLLGLYVVLENNMDKLKGEENKLRSLKNGLILLKQENAELKKGLDKTYYNH